MCLSPLPKKCQLCWTKQRFLLGLPATRNQETAGTLEWLWLVETLSRCLQRPRSGAAGNEEEPESDFEENLYLSKWQYSVTGDGILRLPRKHVAPCQAYVLQQRDGAASTFRAVAFLHWNNQIVNFCEVAFRKIFLKCFEITLSQFTIFLKTAPYRPELYESRKVIIRQDTFVIGPESTDLITWPIMVSWVFENADCSRVGCGGGIDLLLRRSVSFQVIPITGLIGRLRITTSSYECFLRYVDNIPVVEGGSPLNTHPNGREIATGVSWWPESKYYSEWSRWNASWPSISSKAA